MEQSGFGWDDMEKLPTAPDDIWAAYIAVSLLIYLIDGRNIPLL